MKVLIYSETDAAKAKRDELKAGGHHASLRNGQYFNPDQFDKKCDLVITDDQAIRNAYAKIGIEVEPLTQAPKSKAPAVETAPLPEVGTPKTEPVTKAKK